MDVGYTPRQRELGDRARALTRELMPLEESASGAAACPPRSGSVSGS